MKTTPLSIGIVCFSSVGGSGVVACAEAAGLAERGHSVHLFSKAPPTQRLPECAGVTFHRVGTSDYPVFDHPPYTVALASKLVEVSRARKLDVVHVHYAVPHATSAYLARQALGDSAPRIVTSLHGTDVLKVGIHDDYRAMTLFSVAQSDGVVVPSAFLREQALRLLQLPASLPIEVIHNFVDTERFAPAQVRDDSGLRALFEAGPSWTGPVLFHVSTFRPVKRVRDVLEVLARVRAAGVPASLVMVGDGPDREAAEAKASELGVERFVRFLGRRSDFVEYLKQADAFILPSETESFGVAALEALSEGDPVFGYRVGGLTEVVSSDAGSLVTPLDVAALAGEVVAFLGDPARREALRRGARERAVDRFRAGPALDRYEQYLRRVVESPPRERA